MAYFIYLGGLILYFLIHSLLAGTRLKSFLYKFVSPSSYRVYYNIFSFISLSLILVLYFSQSHENLGSHYLLKIFGILLVVGGFWILKLCLPLYDWNDFLGITASQKSKLVQSGIAGQVRHPLYLSTIVVICGFCLLDLNLWSITTLVVSTIYIVVGISFEEKKLVAEFGESYEAYQRQVPKLFPKIRRNG